MNDLKALVKRLTDGGAWHVRPCADSQGDCTCGLPKLIRAVEDHDCMATIEAFCGKPTETDRADNAEAERDRLREDSARRSGIGFREGRAVVKNFDFNWVTAVACVVSVFTLGFVVAGRLYSKQIDEMSVEQGKTFHNFGECEELLVQCQDLMRTRPCFAP